MSLVVYGLATFAATVGYACSRRLSIAESRTITHDQPSTGSTCGSQIKTHEYKDDSISGKSFSSVGEEKPKEILTELPSLKRKRTRDDEHENSSASYPHNLELIYPPKKRSRTPSSEGTSQEVIPETLPVSTTTDAREDPTDVSPAINCLHVLPETPPVPTTTDAHEDPPDVTPVINCLHVLPETPPVPTATDVHGDPVNKPESPGNSAEDSSLVTSLPITPEQPPCVAHERSTTPPPNVVFGSSATMSSPLPKSIQPAHHPVTSNAFSAFVGISSPFSTASPRLSKLKPAWSGSSLSKNLNEESECGTEEGSLPHVLVSATTSKSTEVEYHTGEENEDVKQEIKGVNLFVKRGDRPFSDGMLGHLKLLTHKTTLDERLLFRREPLRQVSLNIRLHPSIRCIWDANDHVLRILVTEPVESKAEREVVIYAFKPGRSCSKQDFREFSEALLKSLGLQVKDMS